MFVRPTSISADGTSVSSAQTVPAAGCPSHYSYSNLGSRSGGSGPHSRSCISGPGSNSGGASRSGASHGSGSQTSGSRGAYKTSSCGSRQLLHNPRSLTSTSVLEEPEEYVALSQTAGDEPPLSRVDQVLETVREGPGLESAHTDDGSVEHNEFQVPPCATGAAASQRRSAILNLDLAQPREEYEVEPVELLLAPEREVVHRTQTWLTHYSTSMDRDGGEEGEMDFSPPSELQIGPASGLGVDLPPVPPQVLPELTLPPLSRTVTLSRRSRLARSTNSLSPMPGVPPAWDIESGSTEPQSAISSDALPTVALEHPAIQSEAGSSSLSAPSNMSSLGNTSFNTSSSSEGANNPPSPMTPVVAADDAMAASNTEELTTVASGTTRAPHRILRLNPWAPLPGPCLASIVAAQQVAVVKSHAQAALSRHDSLQLLATRVGDCKEAGVVNLTSSSTNGPKTSSGLVSCECQASSDQKDQRDSPDSCTSDTTSQRALSLSGH